MRGFLKQINRSNGGMPKRAIAAPVMLGPLGIEGDRQRNLKDHGGPDKAVLMIAAEFIDALGAMGYPVVYGSLGENLTVSSLDPHLWRQGQRYRLGEDAVIELTTLRTPCTHLDVFGSSIKAELYDGRCKARDFASPKWAHGGFYARVVRTGLLTPGAPVILQSDVA
jgi:MOSC domain-containing protein YiiM